jgi:hypothetical protein
MIRIGKPTVSESPLDCLLPIAPACRFGPHVLREQDERIWRGTPSNATYCKIM